MTTTHSPTGGAQIDLDKLEALAKAATPQNLDSAQDATRHDGYIECPECGGEGTVELTADYCNYDGKAMGVQFYGIGPEHRAAEAFFRAANPATVIALIALARAGQQAGQTGDVQTWRERLEADPIGVQPAMHYAEQEIVDLRAKLASTESAYNGAVEQCREAAYRIASAQKDAERWRGFIGSARIKPQGSAGLGEPQPGYYAHMGLEIWTTYDRDYSPKLLEQMDASTALGREWLTKYADIAVQAARAQLTNPTGN